MNDEPKRGAGSVSKIVFFGGMVLHQTDTRAVSSPHSDQAVAPEARTQTAGEWPPKTVVVSSG
jgi:hypothetical protein